MLTTGGRNIYLLRCLESKSDVTVETDRLRLLLADELSVAIEINALLLLESAFNLKR